jgi:hypothetical protein
VKAEATDWEATGGRGILLVAAVATSWGSVPLSGGKQVWAEIALPPQAPRRTSGGDSTGSMERILRLLSL